MLKNVRSRKNVSLMDDVPKKSFFSQNLIRNPVGSEEFQTIELITFELYFMAKNERF